MQKEILTEGFQKEAEELTKEIDQLKEDIETTENKPFISNVLDMAAAAAKSLQSCPTLCSPIDRSPPDSPVPGILQARILAWVAISFSKGSS